MNLRGWWVYMALLVGAMAIGATGGFAAAMLERGVPQYCAYGPGTV